MKIEVDEQCPDCGGTGLYIGMAERDGGIVGGNNQVNASPARIIVICDDPAVINSADVVKKHHCTPLTHSLIAALSASADLNARL